MQDSSKCCRTPAKQQTCNLAFHIQVPCTPQHRPASEARSDKATAWPQQSSSPESSSSSPESLSLNKAKLLVIFFTNSFHDFIIEPCQLCHGTDAKSQQRYCHEQHHTGRHHHAPQKRVQNTHAYSTMHLQIRHDTTCSNTCFVGCSHRPEDS